jgi:MFS transporter, ACS family, glucarate transporter
LMRIVVAWSAFTAMTGAAWSFTSMIVIRFLFGVGEAGCFPIIAKSFTTWLPRSERTRAQGLLWMSARWGGAFTPLLVVWVLQYVNWRVSFTLFGLLGVVWALLFYRWYRDNPRDHPAVNSAELDLMRDIESSSGHGNVPWGRLLASRSVLLLAAQYYFLSFGWYFFLTWLPTYLQEHHRLTPTQSAAYAVFPLFFNGLGSLFCGMATPAITRITGDDARTRKIMAITGFIGAGSFLMLATRMQGVNATMAMMAIACFFNDLVMPHAWASCMDVGGRYAASVAGTMNLMGNLAGTSSTMIGGFLLSQAGGNWNQFITILAAVYFLGVPCWAALDPRTTIDAVPSVSPGLAGEAPLG